MRAHTPHLHNRHNSFHHSDTHTQGCTLGPMAIEYSRGLHLRQSLAQATTQTYLAYRHTTHLPVFAPGDSRWNRRWWLCHTKTLCSTQSSSVWSNGAYWCVDHAAKHDSARDRVPAWASVGQHQVCTTHARPTSTLLGPSVPLLLNSAAMQWLVLL